MTSIANNSVAKIAAVVVGLVLAFSVAVTPVHAALTASQIQSILSLLQSFGADQATINNVNASLTGQPTTPTTPPSQQVGGLDCSAFTRDLTIGSTGSDVMALQKLLNSIDGTQLATTGAGSPGNESSYFGSITQAGVSKFQQKYGISPTAGYFGPITRAKVVEVCSTVVGPVVPGPSAPAGTGLSVSPGAQPANSLAPQGATRVPFTRVTVTAGLDGPVTINSLTVQRTGLGSNAAFAGVVLIDQDGNQLGTAKTFNSNNQATVGEAITIPAGQSRTFTVAGNMASSLSSYAGEAPAISVVAVNTSATVTGSLPITGAYHTMNSTLTVGSVTLATSQAFATNANATKEIGTTGYRTTGFSLTAGSAEDLRLKMIRLNQTGSASTVNDLANIMLNVGGTAYPVTVSSDGKYVTANLGSGVLIPEGNQVEVYVTYDIVGSNSNSRTVIFDVDKTTDIYAEGVTYGYGVSPAAGGSSVPTSRGTFTVTSGTPYIYSTQVTITGASVTTIQKDTNVPAQNIARNVPNQPLGGFITDIKGEAVTVQAITFTVATSSGVTTGTGSPILTNVTIVDENGAVIAGPIDANTAGTSLAFTDAITFPTGQHKYSIRGKVASTIGNSTTYVLSTTPSSQWTNVKGDITGNTITLTQGAFSMNTMTIQAGSLAVSRASSPASQNIVAGGTSVHMVNVQFDATQSGEDARFSSVPVTLVESGGTGKYGTASLLSNCQLFDGATALNTGSNALNPSTSTAAAYTGTLTLDNPIAATKGTVKTLGVRCNVSSSVASGAQYIWNVNDAATNLTVTGATSGTTITPTNGSDNAVIVTVNTGATTVSTDASSPGYKLAAAGSTEVTVGALKFRASNEALNLTKLGLKLTNTGSSSAGDLVKVSIYDGATKVGEAFFSGSNTSATSTLTQIVQLPKDTDKTLTLKADLANIGTGQAVTFSGHFLAVDYLNAEGTGVESGTTQQLGSGAGSTAVAGARIFKSVPTISADSLPSTGIADGRLSRFKVTADSKGPVGITELNLLFSTTTATISNVNIFVYEDASYSQPVSGIGSAGAFANGAQTMASWASSATNFEFTAHNGTASTSLQIPAGGTRYFEVRGTVAGSTTGASITTTLQGASAFINNQDAPSATTNPLATSTNTAFGNELIWSPNSTTTAVRADQDWTGSYGIVGLPANGLINTRSH